MENIATDGDAKRKKTGDNSDSNHPVADTEKDKCYTSETTDEVKCQFFVDRKKRFCKIPVTAGKKLCAEHSHLTNVSTSDTYLVF